MFCSKCGAPADNDARFCDKCGALLDLPELTPRGAGIAAQTAINGKRQLRIVAACIGVATLLILLLLWGLYNRWAAKKVEAEISEIRYTQKELTQALGVGALKPVEEEGKNIDAVYETNEGYRLICVYQWEQAGKVWAAVLMNDRNRVSQVLLRTAGSSVSINRVVVESSSFAQRFVHEDTISSVDVSDCGELGEIAKTAVKTAVEWAQKNPAEQAAVPAMTDSSTQTNNSDQPDSSSQTDNSSQTNAASSSVSTAASSQVQSMPTQRTAAPLAALENMTVVKAYKVKSGASSLRLREAPDVDSDIVDLMWEESELFYLITQQNGWAYGVYLGQSGWCSTEWLVDPGYPYEEQLPSFLTPEQKLIYLQAATLYNATRWGSMGRDFSTEITINGFPYSKCKYFLGKYVNYENTVYSLFTGPHVDAAFFDERFKNQNGELYENSGDGGCILGIELQSYEFRLDKQTVNQIDFTLIGYYNDPYAKPYTKEFPLTMVKGDDGKWRFTLFASPGNGDISFS